MVRNNEAAFPARRRSWPLLGRALPIAALVLAASCGRSSIAPYNPDGAARAGSGGVPAGTGGIPGSSGGQAGTAPVPGSGGHAPGGTTGYGLRPH